MLTTANQRPALPEQDDADRGGGEGEDEELQQGQHVTGVQKPDHLTAQDLVADQREVNVKEVCSVVIFKTGTCQNVTSYPT